VVFHNEAVGGVSRLPDSPPLHINIRTPEGPLLAPGVVTLSPPAMGHSTLDPRAAYSLDLSPRRSPVQIQHSSPYYSPDDSRKVFWFLQFT